MTNTPPKNAEAAVQASTDLLSAMERLRENGWCVVLKCLPKEMGWLVEGARSEYDAPCEDQQIGAGTWLCEVSDMKDDGEWRLPLHSMNPNPMVAVREIIDRVFAD